MSRPPRSTRRHPPESKSWVQQLSHEFTVVIVTHNLQQAARVSEYTAFFYLGEPIEHGSRRICSPLARPTHRSVRDRPVRMTAPLPASTPLAPPPARAR